MKILNVLVIFSLIFLLFVIVTMTLSMPISYETKSIRIMTWNVEWLFMESELPNRIIQTEEFSDIYTKSQKVARQIITLNPDICCLQEVSSMNVLRLLHNIILKNYRINYHMYIQESGGIHKIAILSKFVIKKFYDSNSFIRFSVYWKGNEFIMYCVHLRSRINGVIETEKDRINSLKKLYNDYTMFQDKSVMILGDFNDNFGSNSLNYLSDRKLINLAYTKKFVASYLSKYTYIIDKNKPISINNVRDLDHIFTNYKMYKKILDVFIDQPNIKDDEQMVSDHYPLLAIIQ